MDACKYGCINGKIFMEAYGTLVDCPDCLDIQKIKETPQKNGKTLMEKLRIPPAYKDSTLCGKEILKQSDLMYFTPESINRVGGLLERINQEMYQGKTLGFSTYIYVPNQIDMRRYVYGLQLFALEKGVSMVPYLSLNELAALQRVGDYDFDSLKDLDQASDFSKTPPHLFLALEGYRLIQLMNLTYYDYKHSQLCILEATANTSDRGWAALSDILSERTRAGLSTIVFGYWQSRTVTARKGSKLQYMLAPSTEIRRLDLLLPFEIITPKQEGYAPTGVAEKRLDQVPPIQSSVMAGLSVKDLMDM